MATLGMLGDSKLDTSWGLPGRKDPNHPKKVYLNQSLRPSEKGGRSIEEISKKYRRTESGFLGPQSL